MPFLLCFCVIRKVFWENLWAHFIDNKDKINYLNKLLWQTWKMLAGEAQSETQGEDPSLCHIIIHVFCMQSSKVSISRKQENNTNAT